MDIALTSKVVFMQRIADLVRTGHTQYVCGKVPILKANALAKKFDLAYKTNITKLEQSRKRKRGEASARTLFWMPGKDAEEIMWVLLVSPGQLPAEGEKEKWQDALDRKSRVKVEGYELVRITKPEEPKPVYSWRYEREVLQAWRDSVVHAIRIKRDDELRKHIHNLWRSPGFAGVRMQVKDIANLIKSEFKRSRPNDLMPELPARLGYVRRLASKGISLNEV